MNVAYNAFLSTIFAAFLAAHSVSTTYILFTDFVLEAADAKKKKKVNFPENGLFTLGKGILYGTTVYIICQVVWLPIWVPMAFAFASVNSNVSIFVAISNISLSIITSTHCAELSERNY